MIREKYNKVGENILDLQEINLRKLPKVGGKSANLGELLRIKGIQVPEGFCITTEVFRNIVESDPNLNRLIGEMDGLKSDDRNLIAEVGTKIRRLIETVAIPEEIAIEISHRLKQLDEKSSYAVRSSATAEDLPTASFAGQHDTYLNIMGTEAILKHIRKCWASLFTDRSIVYRLQNGFDHRKVYLAVIVQRMIHPTVSGIMFTADPITSNRKVSSIDASFGLGEALVSGIVNVDNYKVRDGEIIDKTIAAKKFGVYASTHGGTNTQELEHDQQNRQALSDENIVQLERLGRKIEEHFGAPQDIEWCLADDTFYIVQSRPITTLFPIPESNDGEFHLYISVGHQQMMTDAMKPLGLSFWLLMTPANTRSAGGRLFVDITSMLASPESREVVINTLGRFDPLIKGALDIVMKRKEFTGSFPEQGREASLREKPRPLPNYQALDDYDPAIVSQLIKRSQESLETLKQNIRNKTGTELFDFILRDIEQLKKYATDPRSLGVIMTGMNASSWINEKMHEWFGEKNAADIISQSAPNNVTSEMGLELLDVADAIRPYPQVIAYLQQVKDDTFLDELVNFDGGVKTRDAITAYLNKYGMRCAGEIDITRTRWIEKPLTLVPLILSNVKNFEPGAGMKRFEQGRQEAYNKEQDLLNRLRQLPEGEQKAAQTKRMIDLVRNYAGYREYPKYAIINRYWVYKQAVLKEAEKLLHANVVHDKEDIYYLTIDELREVIRTRKLDHELVLKRKEEYEMHQKLRPPRVMTSDGEILTGSYDRENLPAEALVGLAVSPGVVEGRARIIVNMEDADLEAGDILVTTFTDPSWTPLFVSIRGLITEVGGLMSHGAVIAREYGLPALVGVENATNLIKDGQQIRLNGTDGYIEFLK